MCGDEAENMLEALQWARFAARLEEDWRSLLHVEAVDPAETPQDQYLWLASLSERVITKGLITTSRKATPTGEEGGGQPSSALPAVHVRTIIKLLVDGGAVNSSNLRRKTPDFSPYLHHQLPANTMGGIGDTSLAVTAMLWSAASRLDKRIRSSKPEVVLTSSVLVPNHFEAVPLSTRVGVEGGARPIKPLPKELLLSSTLVSWLLATDDDYTESATVCPVNNRVYYCLEERAKLRHCTPARSGSGSPEKNATTGQAEHMADYLEGSFVDISSAANHHERSGCFRVRSMESCRGKFVEGLNEVTAYPHVLQVSRHHGNDQMSVAQRISCKVYVPSGRMAFILPSIHQRFPYY